MIKSFLKWFENFINTMALDECSYNNPCCDPKNYCSVCRALAEVHLGKR